MLLAIVLSFLAVTLYGTITGKGCMAPPKPKPEDEAGPTDGDPNGKKGDATGKRDGAKAEPGPAKKGDDTPKAGDPTPRDPQPESDLSTHPQREVAASRKTLESDELKVVLTSQGGAVLSIQHKNAFEADGTTPFDQILPVDPSLLMGQIDDTGVPPGVKIDARGGADRAKTVPGPLRMPELQWTQVGTESPAEAVFTFKTAKGLVYRKRWMLSQGAHRYDLHLELSVSAPGVEAPEAAYVKLLAVSGQLREHVQGAFSMPSGAIYRLSSTADISSTGDGQFGLDLKELELEGTSNAHLMNFGTRSPFFIALYYLEDEQPRPAITSFWATGEYGKRGGIETTIARFYNEERGIDLGAHQALSARVAAGVKQLNHCWIALRLPVGGAERPTRLSFYVGPIERSTLAQDVYKPLKAVVTYPNAPDFVADILLWIYDFWRSLFGSAGLAVILMTICVRGAMMPLSVRNQLSMRRYGRKVAKLKPKVKQLQQRYANNPKKLREEQMKLYREHGVGFPSGCLMMLVQIPIFFSLFSSLRVEYSIRGAHFLWIKDLSGPDKLIDFGTRLIDLGPMFYVESLNILPLVMVVLSIMHTRNMPKPADEQQAQQMKMMKWLPIIFAVILYNYTAALAMYMVLSSAVAIIESKIVRAKDEHDQEAAPVKA